MNETILVEFIFSVDDVQQGEKFLRRLGSDFARIDDNVEWGQDSNGGTTGYRHIIGKIDAMAATALKFQNKFLADRMRISYIPDDLKDKYRR